MKQSGLLFGVLIVRQGFEHRIREFKIGDFLGEKLPNFSEPQCSTYRSFYRVDKYEPGSGCPWGHSRWIDGEDGKLRMLDHNWDSSG